MLDSEPEFPAPESEAIIAATGAKVRIVETSAAGLLFVRNENGQVRQIKKSELVPTMQRRGGRGIPNNDPMLVAAWIDGAGGGAATFRAQNAPEIRSMLAGLGVALIAVASIALLQWWRP